MERLWAPWRLKFILEHAKRPASEGCIFCHLQEAPLKENYILYRHKLAYVVLNIYPYNTGHLLIIPNRHTASLSDLSPDEHRLCGQLQAESVRILQTAMTAQGVNLGMNLGAVSGAGIPGHLHYHAVPRWAGDTNFMPIVGETRVLPDSLESVYDKLSPSFSRLQLDEST